MEPSEASKGVAAMPPPAPAPKILTEEMVHELEAVVKEGKSVLAHGFHARARDAFGRTPLHIVCMHSGRVEGVRELLEAGADANAQDDWGRAPLHWCCDRGWAEAAQMLLKHAADVDILTKHGDCPLLWAAKAGQATLVQILLSAACKVNLRNNREERPLDVASNPAICTLIEEQMGNVDKDLRGGTVSTIESATLEGSQLLGQKAFANENDGSKIVEKTIESTSNVSSHLQPSQTESGGAFSAYKQRGQGPSQGPQTKRLKINLRKK